MSMPIVKMIIEDHEHELDLNRVMLSEAIALEDDWGLKLTEFKQYVTSGEPPLRAVGAMVWLMQVRTLAAEQGITFPEAAKQLPVATFDVNLQAIREPDTPPEPENPTGPATRTPATRTTRATSAKSRPKRA